MKKIFLFIFIFGFFLFLFHPLFASGFPLVHDGEVITARIAAYRTAFTDGHIPPRWAGNLNYGYGTPVFIFYYPLIGYAGALLSFLGIPYETVYKILLSSGMCLGFFTWYVWMRNRFSKAIGLVSAFLFTTSPYMLLNLYVRGDVGELFALAWVPIVFYLFDCMLKQRTYTSIIYVAASWATLILLHNIVAFLFSFIFVFYLIAVMQGKKIATGVFIICGTSFLALLLSFFFWFPALWELRYIGPLTESSVSFFRHFLSFPNIVTASWGFGTNVNSPGGLAPQLGLVLPVGAILSCCMVLVSKKKDRVFFLFWFTVFIISIFLQLSQSAPLWRSMVFLTKIQFPWRLMGITTIAVIAFISWSLQYVRGKWIYFLLIGVSILFSTQFIGVKEFFQPKSDRWYEVYPGTTVFHNETTTKWTKGDFYAFPEKKAIVSAGNAVITDMHSTSIRDIFTVDAKEQSTLVVYRQFYPGWNVYIDGQKSQIEFQNQMYPGIISFDIPQGRHEVQLRFDETKTRAAANSITGLSIAGCIGILVFLKKEKTSF